MTFTISADDPRTIRAIEIAADAQFWLSGRDRHGEAVFGVPSQCEPGRYYIVTRASCDCADFRQREAQPGRDHVCKHMLAVRLHRELARAEQAPARRRAHLSVVGPTERR